MDGKTSITHETKRQKESKDDDKKVHAVPAKLSFCSRRQRADATPDFLELRFSTKSNAHMLLAHASHVVAKPGLDYWDSAAGVPTGIR